MVGQIGYEMNDFLQDYVGKIGVFLLLLFTLVVIMVRLFNFSPEAIGAYLNNSKVFKSKPDKSSLPNGAAELDLTTEKEEEIVIDTYTHKKDIPPLEPESGLDLNLPQIEEEEIDLKVEKVAEETIETDVKAAKLVKDFGEFDPKLELGNYKFPPINLLEETWSIWRYHH